MRRYVPATVVSVLAVVAIVAAACDDDGTSAGAPTVVNSPIASAPTPPVLLVKTPNAEGAITLVAHNLSFDADEARAPAGPLKLTIDNRDGGTPHNLHVFAGNDNTGASIGDTPIENGPAMATVDVQLDAGAYFFQCDVHPSMHGSLIVG